MTLTLIAFVVVAGLLLLLFRAWLACGVTTQVSPLEPAQASPRAVSMQSREAPPEAPAPTRPMRQRWRFRL